MSTIDRTNQAPPLVAGERLDRATFHERYERMPPGVRAELIGGVVYMPSPAGLRHCTLHALAVFWLAFYRMRTPGVAVADNASTALDDVAEPQPDASLRILPSHGGRTHLVGNILGGGPELIVEVADTSLGIDLGAKRADYERAGVLEYVVFALKSGEVFWHVRRDDRLERTTPDPDGLYRSGVFPGLWLDPRAFLADDAPALIATLERGLATPGHADFVARLAAANARP